MKKFKNFLLDGYSTMQSASNRVKKYRLAVPIAFAGLMLFVTSASAQTSASVSANKNQGAAGPLFTAGATLQNNGNGSQGNDGGSIKPPDVPFDIRVEDGNEVFLIGHANGTQNYVCLPCDPTKPNCTAAGVGFSLFTPQATLFDEKGGQIITHFFSPNPFENGTIRATWQSSKDTSTVWAKATGSVTPDPNSIAWLRLDVKNTGSQPGPTGGDKLTKTTFIQRINTVGGVAPADECRSPADIGHEAFVHYRSDYVFFRAAGKHDDNQ